MTQQSQELQYSKEVREALDTKTESKYEYVAEPGLTEEIVRLISKEKREPDWMLQKRLKALEYFHQLETPTWGPDISKLDISKIIYYAKADAKKNARKWEDLPPEIRNTFQKLGIPEAEQKYLAGAG